MPTPKKDPEQIAVPISGKVPRYQISRLLNIYENKNQIVKKAIQDLFNKEDKRS